MRRPISTTSSSAGFYLATIGHCMECHTPFVPPGGPDFANSLGKGGREFPGPWGVSKSRNITSHKTAGIGDWTDAEIKTAITQGKRKDGTPLKGPMGFQYYAKMTDADLDAVIAWVRTLAAEGIASRLRPRRSRRSDRADEAVRALQLPFARGLYLWSADREFATMPVRLRLLSALAASLLVLLPQGAAAQDRVVPPSAEALRLSYAPIVKRVVPAVVTVSAAKTVANRNPLMEDPFFRRFFGPQFGGPREQTQQSLGSGVIVDPSGLIVTNNHVIDGADQVKISLADKREFAVDVVLKDPRADLAVLRVKDDKKERFPVIDFGNSDDLQVGDVVLAIGNPFGVGQTVTHGIVSAVARTQVGISDYQFFIQTDAAINPGNSGGALVDMAGRLVGINTAIFSRSGGSQGVGFAIPATMVRLVVASARAGGNAVKRPWLGAKLQALTPELSAGVQSAAAVGGGHHQRHRQGPGRAGGPQGRRRHRRGRRPAGRRSQRLRLSLHDA